MKTDRTEFQALLIETIEENFKNDKFTNRQLLAKAKDKDPNLTIYQINIFLQKREYIIQHKDKTFSLDYTKLVLSDKHLMTAQDVRELMIKKQEEIRLQKERELNSELIKIMGSIKSKISSLESQTQVETPNEYKNDLVTELVKLGFMVEMTTQESTITVKW